MLFNDYGLSISMSVKATYVGNECLVESITYSLVNTETDVQYNKYTRTLEFLTIPNSSLPLHKIFTIEQHTTELQSMLMPLVRDLSSGKLPDLNDHQMDSMSVDRLREYVYKVDGEPWAQYQYFEMLSKLMSQLSTGIVPVKIHQ